jgi:nucleotide-binding universal stress UspA family protein
MNNANTYAVEKEPQLQTTRLRFENILVMVDLAISSSNTLRIAAELAERAGANLVVAHVLDPLRMLPSEMALDTKEALALWVKPYVTRGTRSTIKVLEGDLVREAEALAKEYKADLLVIGTHSVTGVKKLVFGSKAEALYRQISIPILTVPPHGRVHKEKFNSILLPTDLKPHSLRAAQYAVSMAEESNAKLTFLHVLEQQDESEAGAISQLKQLVSEDAALWCTPEFRTSIGDPANTILATATELNADLIVLGVTNRRSLAGHGAGSVASKIVTHADCPVLTVRNHL